MQTGKKRRLIVCMVLIASLSCLFGWRVMPRIWKWAKGLFVQPAVTVREPYVPVSSCSLQDVFSAEDSVIYYFYKDNCPYCEEIDGIFKGLPEEILLQNGQKSAVKLVCVNKNEHLQVCNAYYEAAGIPENQRFVPAVAVGEHYLFAPSEILEGLYSALLSGDGLCTPMIGDNLRE